MTDRYFVDGERRACELGNRGPLRFDDNGRLHPDIEAAYWRSGFYVFEGVVQSVELAELVREFEQVLTRAPCASESSVDANGRPAIGVEFTRPSFRFARPLSDPHGGTDSTYGRYPVQMSQPEPPADAPDEVLYQMSGILQLMDSALRLYGHPALLTVAEQINGPDFVPFTDTIWIKPAGLGASVAWHQDGTSHWDAADLDAGTHGFNFMMQIYDTNAENSLWVVPGSHEHGRIDIQARVADNGGDHRLPSAVPMLAQAGDVAICNRQLLHGSFANTTSATRATYVFGFHRRASVLGVKGWAEQPYDAARIHARSRLIALAIDARAQRFPAEPRYVYQPLAAETDDNRWNEVSRQRVLANYNLNDLGI